MSAFLVRRNTTSRPQRGIYTAPTRPSIPGQDQVDVLTEQSENGTIELSFNAQQSDRRNPCSTADPTRVSRGYQTKAGRHLTNADSVRPMTVPSPLQNGPKRRFNDRLLASKKDQHPDDGSPSTSDDENPQSLQPGDTSRPLLLHHVAQQAPISVHSDQDLQHSDPHIVLDLADGDVFNLKSVSN